MSSSQTLETTIKPSSKIKESTLTAKSALQTLDLTLNQDDHRKTKLRKNLTELVFSSNWVAIQSLIRSSSQPVVLWKDINLRDPQMQKRMWWETCLREKMRVIGEQMEMPEKMTQMCMEMRALEIIKKWKVEKRRKSWHWQGRMRGLSKRRSHQDSKRMICLKMLQAIPLRNKNLNLWVKTPTPSSIMQYLLISLTMMRTTVTHKMIWSMILKVLVMARRTTNQNCPCLLTTFTL